VRRFGQLLALLGLALGGLLGVGLMLPGHLTGIAWLAAVGIAKFTFVSSLGLIAGGAILQRIANQRARRAALPPARTP
jgi:hypothetical protein